MSETLHRKVRIAVIHNCWECPHVSTRDEVSTVSFGCIRIGPLFKIVKQARPIALIMVDARAEGIHKDCPLELR